MLASWPGWSSLPLLLAGKSRVEAKHSIMPMCSGRIQHKRQENEELLQACPLTCRMRGTKAVSTSFCQLLPCTSRPKGSRHQLRAAPSQRAVPLLQEPRTPTLVPQPGQHLQHWAWELRGVFGHLRPPCWTRREVASASASVAEHLDAEQDSS